MSRNSQTICPSSSPMSSKVIDFNVNGKPICDFLLVINCNFSRICYLLEIFTLKDRQESCAIAKMTARCALNREPLRRYGYSKLSKMAAAAILNLFESNIAPLEPPSPKTHPGNNKHEVDRITSCRDMAYVGGIWNPILGEGEVVGGQRWHH